MRGRRAQLYRNAQASSRGPISTGRELDAVDRALIEALQQNGRVSFRRIAGDARVSEATIRARYARLCRDEILHVTAITNPLTLGFGAMAMVGVKTGGPPGPVAEQVTAWDEAGYVVITAGQFDILVEFVCEDGGHLLDLTDRLRTLDGVVSTETFLYLELRKELHDWGVGEALVRDGGPVA